MINIAEYAKRRQTLQKQIGSSAIVILPAAPLAKRNGDYDYPYRPNSDFFYMTGFEEPEAVAILLPKRKEGEFILFNRERNREVEIWEGVRVGQKEACTRFGVDESFAINEFEKRLPDLLEGRDEIYYSLGLDTQFDQIVLNAVNKIRGKIRSGSQSPIAFVDSTTNIHEMRLIKSPAEIEIMRKAAEISVDGHLRAMQHCEPGLYEYQLEADLMYEFVSQGARYPAYSPIIGSEKNTCTLHYSTNNELIKEKSMILIDAGCEYYNYASDITRSFPANGKFSGEQRAIYEIVLAAQSAGIKTVKPGVEFSAIQTVIVNIITQGLLDLGILKGKLSDLIDKKAYSKFYMHNSGHWLGLDVHDVGRYKLHDKWRKLKAGMVLTVEPGIYISADIPGVHKRWHNIGIRIEDDILVTQKGSDVLSKGLPKTIEEIETIMS